ncbi:Hsp33 family molecular chaperone HslO [Thermodesulfatator autotrophicus]|uniref:33 kDa chaperonin n=1 Tax=Thermodesulfatator autotrophicus TaxID=1795632 RepID=A0A177E6A8_9BACT|nr:Hsp33 family molecular chaperone HslO [Thermodesulfatator autotrophicus]OAG27318.1 molecular chaperone Hsp33 [Thermodesulfatator autotrophicus]
MSYAVRGMTKDGAFRIFAADTKDIVEEARKIHRTSPTATAVLGRALTAAALLGLDLKTGRVMIQINGGGPIGEVLAEADAEGNVRGLVQKPNIHLTPQKGKLLVGQAVGRNGFISVTRDLGLKEPYQGSTKLISGEIAEDVSYYLTVSEQIPSAVGLGVFVDTDNQVKAAGGFLIQTLPAATEEQISNIEEVLKKLPPVTSLLREEKLNPEEILYRIFGKDNVEILEKRPLAYRCRCSRERVERALVALGPKEIEELIKKNEPARITCDFCNQEYIFTIEELEKLLSQIEKKSRRELDA